MYELYTKLLVNDAITVLQPAMMAMSMTRLFYLEWIMLSSSVFQKELRNSKIFQCFCQTHMMSEERQQAADDRFICTSIAK